LPKDERGGSNFGELRRRAEREDFSLKFLPFLDGGEIPLFCHGFCTLIAAYPKSGKTSLLFPLACQWAQAGNPVFYLTEEPEHLWKPRLLAGPREGIDEMEGFIALGTAPAKLLALATAAPQPIIIVDTTNLLGIQDGNDAATVAQALTPWVSHGAGKAEDADLHPPYHQGPFRRRQGRGPAPTILQPWWMPYSSYARIDRPTGG